MTPFLLDYLCEPITKLPLSLRNAQYDNEGNITSGELVSESSKVYPIIKGVPRFIDFVPAGTVKSFGDEWNHFNFIDFKVHWLEHTVKNTFGTTEYFNNKVIVDAGGGSGSQSKWFAEYGAKHVIMMDLSHSVDDVVQRNFAGIKNIDAIQCSIDAPPLRDQCIEGLVYCHNVIQHTPSVENTAKALYALVAKGGEFAFNCYPLNNKGPLRWFRYHVINNSIRAVLSRSPFGVILFYSRLMASLRLVPVVGMLLEKCGFLYQGDVPRIENESKYSRLKRRFKATSLNTFDWFGSHEYQHHKSDDDIKNLLRQLQPDQSKVKNIDKYFQRPPYIGCALRIER